MQTLYRKNIKKSERINADSFSYMSLLFINCIIISAVRSIADKRGKRFFKKSDNILQEVYELP